MLRNLLENAIDAGATAVTVEIEDGGVSLIRITDNGCGILREDVRNAFLRHSTSKIESVEDLSDLRRLDFAGEALSSIAAVTKVELITKPKEESVRTRYVIEGGKEISMEETGASDGTCFLIRQLFYNVPAREAFKDGDDRSRACAGSADPACAFTSGSGRSFFEQQAGKTAYLRKREIKRCDLQHLRQRSGGEYPFT